ncbi:CHASE domain-containing protein [Rufibacter ruber]|uniref:CHASE domain-containing protein n=1 Tax=Rufibacter ruber TaxID=1783499 RepID=UPI00082AC566|nr:CHASE domain-containing protein [Rufibacter ruber]
MIFSRLKDYYLALGSFVLVLGITLYAYYVSKTSDQEQDAQVFKLRTEQVRETLERRMGNYLQILKGVDGLFTASDTVTYQDFKRYVSSLQIEKTYPGVQGFGYAAMLTPEQVPTMEARMQSIGFTNFKVAPASPRTEYSSIIFLEPMDARNRRAHGFDMFHDPIRREAMEAARDFNAPAITGIVTLRQEENDKVGQPGLLIYMPVYYQNAEPVALEERRRLLKGFVYAPFRAKDLMNSTIGRELKDISISIYDGKKPKPESLIYTNDTTDAKLDTSGRKLYLTEVMRIAGRTWTLEFKPRESFSDQRGIDEHNLILLAGGIISLLIFFVVWSQQRYLQSNQLTELVTNNTTAGLFMLDKKGYCTFQNPAAEKLLGYSNDDLRQRPFHELVHRKQEMGNLAPELNSQKAHAFEDIFICRNGKTIPVACASRQVKQGGEIEGFILEVRDVTEERKAQQALVESEARFRSMADSAPVMVWMTDDQNSCTYVNRQWLEYTGTTLQDSLGDHWLALVHPDDKAKAFQIFNAATESQTEFQSEFRLRRHDGEFRWMMNTGSPRFGAEGNFLGYIGSALDITERILMENRLKSNAEMLQQIFMQVPAIVGLVRTKDLQYTLVNAYLREFYDGRAMVGVRAPDALPLSQQEQFTRIIQNIAQTGEPYIGQEVPVYFDETPAGQEHVRFFNMVYEPIKNRKGEVTSVLTFAVEVTEQVLSREQLSVINEELNRKNKELTRINNDLDSFVYTASHDLRSPLANLEGLTTALLENAEEKPQGEDDEDRMLLQMVASSIAKLKGTIHDLTEITKVQKDLESQAEELAFSEVLTSIEEDIHGMIQEAGVTVQREFAVPQIRYARKNLRSILYNLVSNAIKYREPTRPLQVNVRTRREGEYVVLTVQDNGLGIREDQQEKLFTMFRRFHSHVEGTGIGLYIVKRIIENNGGYIEVESEPGKGSTFTVHFKEEA